MSINLKQRYEQRRLVELRETLEIADFDYLVERHDMLLEALSAAEKKNITKMLVTAKKIDLGSFKSAVEVAQKKIGKVISGKFFSNKANVEKFADLIIGFTQALKEIIDTVGSLVGEEIDPKDTKTIGDFGGGNDVKNSIAKLLNDSIERSARRAFDLNVKSLTNELMLKSPADIVKMTEILAGGGETPKGGEGTAGDTAKGKEGEKGGEADSAEESKKAEGLKSLINNVAIESEQSPKLVKKVFKTLFKLGAIKENKAFSISRLLLEQDNPSTGQSGQDTSAQEMEEIKTFLKGKLDDKEYFRDILMLSWHASPKKDEFNYDNLAEKTINAFRQNSEGEINGFIREIIILTKHYKNRNFDYKKGASEILKELNKEEKKPEESQESSEDLKKMANWLKKFPDLAGKAAAEANRDPKKFIEDIEGELANLNKSNPRFVEKEIKSKYNNFQTRIKKLSSVVTKKTGLPADIVNSIVGNIPANKIVMGESINVNKTISLKERYALRNR